MSQRTVRARQSMHLRTRRRGLRRVASGRERSAGQVEEIWSTVANLSTQGYESGCCGYIREGPIFALVGLLNLADWLPGQRRYRSLWREMAPRSSPLMATSGRGLGFPGVAVSGPTRPVGDYSIAIGKERSLHCPREVQADGRSRPRSWRSGDRGDSLQWPGEKSTKHDATGKE